jgi:O-antigen ligase
VARPFFPDAAARSSTATRTSSSGVSLAFGTNLIWRNSSAIQALAVLVVIGALSAAQGGYFPSAWNWGALGLAWAAGLALAFAPRISLSRAELALLGLLGALAAWVALSLAWSGSTPETIDEIQRALVYVTGALAFLLLARLESVGVLLGAMLIALTGVCAYALATRLFPRELSADVFGGYRLSTPVGYWNGLGLLAAIGALLALGFAASQRHVFERALAAAAMPVLLCTLYFTFSRGAWVALAAGCVLALALDPRRLRLVTTGLALAVSVGLAIWLASQSSALTHRGSILDAAAHEGHRLAAWIALFAALAAATAVGLDLAERRIRVPARVRRAYAAALVLLAVGGLAAALAAGGGPVHLAKRGYDDFTSNLTSSTNLNRRLFSLSSHGRTQLWHVAARQFEAHPVTGGGAGSFEQYWNRNRPSIQTVKDAHSVYLETLAELGIPGLVLLVAVLAIPFTGVRARGQPLVPVALGAYAGLVVHFAYDWDWELPAVTLAGLFCGLAALVAARDERRTVVLGARSRAIMLGAVGVFALFAFVALIGNIAISRAQNAVNAGHYAKAAGNARRATSWAPWSARAWLLLGQAQAGLDRKEAAVTSLRHAVADDPRNYRYWLGLAAVAHGKERVRALEEAFRLNPRFNTGPGGPVNP